MNIADVAIYLPYRLEETAGNSVTALRLRQQLVAAGFSVVITAADDTVLPARCLVALNAFKSAAEIGKFSGRVVALLTGTDINNDRIRDESWEGYQAMQRADRLVVLQEEAFGQIPSSFHEKSVVIRPSVNLPDGLSHRGSGRSTLRVILAARFRPEKGAEVVLDACRQLADSPSDTTCVKLDWFGATAEAQAPGFQWRGPVSQTVLWNEMADADLFLNASHEEGGANAVCEAMALGMPILASRIGGNLGLLGTQYSGYFEPGNASDLAEKLRSPALHEWGKQVLERRKLFTYEQESQAWVDLIRGVLVDGF